MNLQNRKGLPMDCKSRDADAILYSSLSTGGEIAFRSLDLEKDLAMIHTWVNMDYTRTFWQMRGSLGLLRSCYQCILQNPFAHSFIGIYNQDSLICQFDIYLAVSDEISRHIPVEDQDCGFHLIMAPVQKRVHGLTLALIRSFLDFYFSFDAAIHMYAEPDVTNEKSISLLEQSGFCKLKTIEMSYKSAHVYRIDKKTFHEQNQKP